MDYHRLWYRQTVCFYSLAFLQQHAYDYSAVREICAVSAIPAFGALAATVIQLPFVQRLASVSTWFT